MSDIISEGAEVAESVDPCCASQTIVTEAEGAKQMEVWILLRFKSFSISDI